MISQIPVCLSICVFSPKHKYVDFLYHLNWLEILNLSTCPLVTAAVPHGFQLPLLGIHCSKIYGIHV